MEFLIGDKEIFYNFLENINPEKDKVAIVSHNDMDGVGSVFFLEKILESKKIRSSFVDFFGYEKDILLRLKREFKKKKITKVFILDFNIDSNCPKEFDNFKSFFDVFFIDHHPIGEIQRRGNVIKTNSYNCATQIVYELSGGIVKFSEKDLAVLYAALVTDYTFTNEDNLSFLQQRFPEINIENIFSSIPGTFGSSVDRALINLKSSGKSLKKVYSLLKKRDLVGIKKLASPVKKETDFWINKFLKEADYYPKQDIYFYFFKPKFQISSIVSSISSRYHPSSVLFILVPSETNKELLKISVRNNSGNRNVPFLFKSAIAGLKDAIAGGHPRAMGGLIRKKDLEKFKENLLSVS